MEDLESEDGSDVGSDFDMLSNIPPQYVTSACDAESVDGVVAFAIESRGPGVPMLSGSCEIKMGVSEGGSSLVSWPTVGNLSAESGALVCVPEVDKWQDVIMPLVDKSEERFHNLYEVTRYTCLTVEEVWQNNWNMQFRRMVSFAENDAWLCLRNMICNLEIIVDDDQWTKLAPARLLDDVSKVNDLLLGIMKELAGSGLQISAPTR
ncbi:hypothetical protein GUJ93_ZPchr0004g39312 [Zizania palustris]|uniref:Uncharacterized protein n=1 Tax=Zizania palustris TaxID=103762 RepID=A0A8J5SYP0_ZIZPA|nr:hypothetical protein GUJ93_ZPchr0004g39312 [Zizania palustris]